MKNLTKTLLAFTILLLTFSNTKAQDDCRDCGMLINNVLVDTIKCWNAKKVYYVFPIKQDWKKYQRIELGDFLKDETGEGSLFMPWLNLTNGFYFTNQEFFSYFSEGDLGLLCIPFDRYIDTQEDGSGLYTRFYGKGTFEKDKKSDALVRHDGNRIIQIRGRTIISYKETFNGKGTLVKMPIYSDPIILWQSKPVALIRYAVDKKNKLVNQAHQTYVPYLAEVATTGTCEVNGRAFPYKIESANYSKDFFIVKKGGSPTSNNTTTEVKTITKTETKLIPATGNPNQPFTLTGLKPLDKTKPGYFAEKDGSKITREGYKKGSALNGEVRDYNDDGKIRSIYTYVNDEKNGYSATYFDTGKIELTGNYKNGEKDGEWKEYDSDGKLLSTKKYLNGEVED